MYPVEALRQKALAAGYPSFDVEEAIRLTEPRVAVLSSPLVKLSSSEVSFEKTVPHALVNQAVPVTEVVSRLPGKKGTSFGIMMFAGILGFLFFIGYLTAITAGVYFEVDMVSFFTGWWAIGITLFSCLYLVGFIRLNTHVSSPRLRFATYARIGTLVGLAVIYWLIRPALLDQTLVVGSVLLGFAFAFVLLWIVAKYLFASGLIHLGKTISFLKVVGILTYVYMSLISLGFVYFLYVYFGAGLPLQTSDLILLYWDFVVIGIFTISSLFFESIALLYAHKKFE